ncbi:MAG TPA: hypothetical protein VF813_01310, partial [Anaerolineaceae bacterium]
MLKPPVHRALPMPLLAAGMVLLAAGAACTFLTPTPIAWTATATPRPSPPPSETAAARLPAQPPTLEPTATPTRPVGTAAPTAPPESKPLLLYGQGAEVSAWDPAAAHATAVSLESPLFWPGDLGSGASPAGQWLAVRAGHSGLADLSLDLIQFPQGAVRAHIPLLAESVRAKLPAGGAGRLPDAAAAAVQPDTLAWSPDG